MKLSFPEGLPGFEGKTFELVEEDGVEWICAPDDPSKRMMVLDPDGYELDYTPKPKDAELAPIRPDGPDEAYAFRIVVRQGENDEAVLNLFAPILINFAKNLAMQVPLVGSGYSVTEPWPAG